MNEIKRVFDTISAEESLKKSTVDFLKNERAKRSRSFQYIYKYAAVCAVMLVFVFGLGSYSVFNTAVSYISIDVNPSIELALNRFDHVVEAAAYNDDGAAVLNGLDLKGKSYTEAIDILMEKQEFVSYLEENNRLDFTVVSDRQDELMNGIQGCRGYAQYNGCCHSADNSLAEQAHEHGFSVGKYRAYKELARYDENVTEEDCKNMTMRQIYDMIGEHSTENGTVESHHGYGKNQSGSGNQHHRKRK